MSFSWNDKYPLLYTIFLKVTHHYHLKLLLAYSRYYNRPSRPSTYFYPLNLPIFEVSSMSTYQRSWPLWTPEEDVMLVYYCDRGFEAVDVALIIACRLRRGVRTLRAIVNRMQWINRTRAQMGLRPLCTNDTADWDRVAVNNFIIHSAADSDSLQRLLWFHNQYIPLLRTVRLVLL